MGNEHDAAALIDTVLGNIAAEEMELIDFDLLREKLNTIKGALVEMSDGDEQLSTLREDYRQRIAGMIKAIAAVDRRRIRNREALELIESLDGLDAAGLIRCYRVVAARFRDAFPSSVALLRESPGTGTAAHRS